MYDLYFLAAYDCLDSCLLPACLVLPALPCDRLSPRGLKSLFLGFPPFAPSSCLALGSLLLLSQMRFHFCLSVFPAKVKIDKHFWALASAMLEITWRCFLPMSNANVLSTAMLTQCSLFIPTRGAVLFSETLKRSDGNAGGGNQRGDQVPDAVSSGSVCR